MSRQIDIYSLSSGDRIRYLSMGEVAESEATKRVDTLVTLEIGDELAFTASGVLLFTGFGERIPENAGFSVEGWLFGSERHVVGSADQIDALTETEAGKIIAGWELVFRSATDFDSMGWLPSPTGEIEVIPHE